MFSRLSPYLSQARARFVIDCSTLFSSLFTVTCIFRSLDLAPSVTVFSRQKIICFNFSYFLLIFFFLQHAPFMAPCSVYYQSCDRIISIISVILCTEDAELCPHGWSASLTSRSCIRPFRKRTRWVNARTECQALGGDLLTNYDKEKGVVVNGIYSLIK